MPVVVRVFGHLAMSRSGTTREPLFIGNGLSDSVGDALATDVKELAYISPHRGVPVERHIYNGQNHDLAGMPFFDQAEAFAQRCQKLPFQIGRADIGPGITIDPIPAPAS